MSPGALAGNPLFISPELLVQDGLLREDEIQPPEFSEYTVDYAAVTLWKEGLIRKGISRFDTSDPDFAAYRAAHPWIEDYALISLLKKQYGQRGIGTTGPKPCGPSVRRSFLAQGRGRVMAEGKITLLRSGAVSL